MTVCMESPGCKCFTHGACEFAAYSLGNGLPFCRDSFERFILMKTIASAAFSSNLEMSTLRLEEFYSTPPASTAQF